MNIFSSVQDFLTWTVSRKTLAFKWYICEMRRNRVSLGNSSVKTGRVSRFGAEIDSGGAQDTIEWEISLYVRLGPGTDMSDYF